MKEYHIYRFVFSLVFLCASIGAQARSAGDSLEKLMNGQPLSEADTDQAMQNPKNASQVAMMEAFNLLRRGDLADSGTRSLVLKYLSYAEGTFGDLRQPDNFSMAFSADADTPYRGRPHERVLTAVMLAVMDMERGRYDMALPTLKNAEFLDARWQSMPYGTDAPLVYALSLRALTKLGSSQQDVDRARHGLYRSIRMLTLQEHLIEAANNVAAANMRNDAVAVKIAHVLLATGISSALINAADDASIFNVITAAAQEAGTYVSVLEQKFAGEYEQYIKPSMANVARVAQIDAQSMANISFGRVGLELDLYAKEIIKVLKARPARETRLALMNRDAKKMAREIEKAVVAPSLLLRFEGVGPKVVRSGEYDEIAQIVKSATGSVASEIREKSIAVAVKCGLSNMGDSLTVLLCDDRDLQKGEAEKFTALELWSSSRKATSVMGRRFEKILKGRAQFRATTESIAAIGAVTALALLSASSDVYSQCRARGGSASQCQQQGAALAGAAAIAAGISGAVWLIGRASNPEADPRFVPSMFESGYLLVPNRTSR